ncbi:hypothetical protein [Pseudomonas chlororaphis]
MTITRAGINPSIRIAIGYESRQANRGFIDLVINDDLFNFKGH